jgi:polyhydroxybutyrate depolymerase
MISAMPKGMRWLLALLFAAPLLAQTAAPARGDVTATLAFAGAERTVLLRVPPACDGERALPLVLFLHGRGDSGPRAARRYGFSQLADEHGFLVAYPTAGDRARGWQPGYYAAREGQQRSDDDRPFLTALLDHVAAEYRVDGARVFAAGHSSGAIMSYALAAAHPERIAAIGAVAGSIGVRGPGGRAVTVPAPRAPVSLIAFHGQRDRILPYDEVHGEGALYPFFVSAPDSVAFWAKHVGCAPEPQREALLDGRVLHDRWQGDCATVELYTLTDQGHYWPSGAADSPLAASRRIWEFFAAHPKQAVATGKQATDK